MWQLPAPGGGTATNSNTSPPPVDAQTAPDGANPAEIRLPRPGVGLVAQGQAPPSPILWQVEDSSLTTHAASSSGPAPAHLLRPCSAESGSWGAQSRAWALGGAEPAKSMHLPLWPHSLRLDLPEKVCKSFWNVPEWNLPAQEEDTGRVHAPHQPASSPSPSLGASPFGALPVLSGGGRRQTAKQACPPGFQASLDPAPTPSQLSLLSSQYSQQPQGPDKTPPVAHGHGTPSMYHHQALGQTLTISHDIESGATTTFRDEEADVQRPQRFPKGPGPLLAPLLPEDPGHQFLDGPAYLSPLLPAPSAQGVPTPQPEYGKGTESSPFGAPQALPGRGLLPRGPRASSAVPGPAPPGPARAKPRRGTKRPGAGQPGGAIPPRRRDPPPRLTRRRLRSGPAGSPSCRGSALGGRELLSAGPVVSGSPCPGQPGLPSPACQERHPPGPAPPRPLPSHACQEHHPPRPAPSRPRLPSPACQERHPPGPAPPPSSAPRLPSLACQECHPPGPTPTPGPASQLRPPSAQALQSSPLYQPGPASQEFSKARPRPHLQAPPSSPSPSAEPFQSNSPVSVAPPLQDTPQQPGPAPNRRPPGLLQSTIGAQYTRPPGTFTPRDFSPSDHVPDPMAQEYDSRAVEPSRSSLTAAFPHPHVTHVSGGIRGPSAPYRGPAVGGNALLTRVASPPAGFPDSSQDAGEWG
ncbi:basic proline-rich protein-like [Loxodonta africana]|uniref:basic proline-rich protein-like n=1 Tax=Loxodonta africana TaxID=9785 RepID=UPI0030D5F980